MFGFSRNRFSVPQSFWHGENFKYMKNKQGAAVKELYVMIFSYPKTLQHDRDSGPRWIRSSRNLDGTAKLDGGVSLSLSLFGGGLRSERSAFPGQAPPLRDAPPYVLMACF